jgi:endogenous inhibitor of DNA gyrase (YacG/DUF329 family)
MIPKRFLELPCPKCEKTVRRLQKKDDKSFFFWVHIDEDQGAVCEPYLLDVKEKPVTKESLEKPCPKCAKPLKRVQKRDKSIWFWVHVDESEKSVCDPYLLDVKEKPVTKESLEQPCPKCAKPLKRMQKTDKSSWFWVHANEANAEGCERFLPDIKGKPTTNELLEQPCPFCKNAIKRLRKKETKEWFWVHTSQPASGVCTMYLGDTKGEPTSQQR